MTLALSSTFHGSTLMAHPSTKSSNQNKATLDHLLKSSWSSKAQI
jgi:hypothetical protein